MLRTLAAGASVCSIYMFKAGSYQLRAESQYMAEPLTSAADMAKSSTLMRVRMEKFIMSLQGELCKAFLEEEEKGEWRVDRWTREEGGGGITCVIQDGHVFEKAGVGVSVVHGMIPPAAVKQMNARGKNLPEGEEMPFFACGISCVVHPRWWFGGGSDLTPYYLDEEDGKLFHTTLKTACDKHDKGNISRGIGGIFFDDLDSPGIEECFAFVQDCGNSVIPSYLPMIRKNKNKDRCIIHLILGYGYAERQWQLMRRGHYAEYNLVYDRGTKFGLYTPGARIESILMSLPLNAKWEYMHTPEPGEKTKILLMGLRRSGKSSIQKVVFHKMSPNETLFLESTNKVQKDDISNSSFVQFSIWDFPGQIDFFDPTFEKESLFGNCGALIFVIDAQDDYLEALSKLHDTVTKAYQVNPNIRFEVFIHKVDGLSDDTKMETQRDIHQRANDDIIESGLEQQVVQKLIPQLATLENLINIFVSNSQIEKAFLFDVVSKIYVATDSTPVDMQTYELCCDMIDVVIDVSCIYGLGDEMDSSAFDEESASVIKLNNSTILLLKEVSKVLALVCIMREENYQHSGLVQYNFKCFRDAIEDVFAVRAGRIQGGQVIRQFNDKALAPVREEEE